MNFSSYYDSVRLQLQLELQRMENALAQHSPNQEGVEGTGSEEVWMITAPSAILVIWASLRE